MGFYSGNAIPFIQLNDMKIILKSPIFKFLKITNSKTNTVEIEGLGFSYKFN